MKKLTLLLLSVGMLYNLNAQFSAAQKDSVLKELGYASGDISMNINFQPGEYSSKQNANPYKDLTEEQLLAKKTNTYKDATIYKQLCLLYFTEKKDMAGAGKYFDLAIEQYSIWVDKDFEDPVPFVELFGLFYGTQSYNPIANVMKEALLRFPKNKEVLEWVCLINLDLYKDFDKTQLYINELLAIEPYNLTACTYQIMLYQYKYILAMGSDAPKPAIDISIAEKALEAKPKEVGYQHLLHFAKVAKGYMEGVEVFLKTTSDDDTDYEKLFSTLNPSQKKDFEAAEVFFKTQLGRAGAPQLNLLSSLGFVSMYLGKREAAKKYFQQLYDEEKTLKNLENLILIGIVEKRWADTEALLEKSITAHNTTKSYLSLMGLYTKFMKDKAKQEAMAQRVEKIEPKDENMNLLLCSWYLKQKNVEKGASYLNLINKESEPAYWRFLALSVLKDDKEGAALYMNKILTVAPKDEDAIKLKALLKL